MTAPLSLAIKGNHIDAVHLLLRSGSHAPTDKDLYDALNLNNADMVSILLDDYTVSHKSGHCLRLLMKNYPLPLFRKLLHIYTPYDLVTYNVLHDAAFWGNSEHIEDILACGVNINDKNDDTYVSFGVGTTDSTPLHVAVCNARIDNVKYLLQHGADHTIKNHSWLTPLNLAIKATNRQERRELYSPIVELLSTLDG
jgi:ankyrin repeat protein